MKTPKATPFRAFFQRWVKGEQLAKLASEAGIKRSKFRRTIIVECGGKEMFKDYRNRGAGGRHEPGANLRRARAARGDAPLVDDSTLPMTTDTSRAAGWTTRRIWEGQLVKVRLPDGERQIPWRKCKALVFIAPDGEEYVEASASERADLLRIYPEPGRPATRLRLLETSKVARDVKAQAKLVERGTKALAATRARKRAAKATRRAGKKP